jgi:hypothetical protein
MDGVRRLDTRFSFLSQDLPSWGGSCVECYIVTARLKVDCLHLILGGFPRQIREIMRRTTCTCNSVHDPDRIWPLDSAHCNQGAGIIPQNRMSVYKPLGYGLIIAAFVALSFHAANSKNFFEEVKDAAVPQFKAQGGSLQIQQGPLKETLSANPLSGPPRVESNIGNKDIDNLVKNIDGAVHLPQDAASAAGDAVMKEAKKAVDNFIADFKAKALAKYEELKAKAMPYVYMAAAALILTLMLPGFIGALFAIWVVRLLDRRQARKQKRKLNKALAIVKDHADEIHTKLAA